MAGSQMSYTQTPKRLKPDLIPPRGAKAVGVYDDGSPTGAIVYEMDVLDVQEMKRQKYQKRDPVTGELIFKKHPTTGENQYPVLVLPKPIMRRKRFILRSYRTGQVRMVENFAETPEDIAEREERQRVEAFSHDLAVEAVRRGFPNAAEMMSTLFGDDTEVDEATQVMVSEATQIVESGQLETAEGEATQPAEQAPEQPAEEPAADPD